MTKNRTPTPVYLDPGLEVKGLMTSGPDTKLIRGYQQQVVIFPEDLIIGGGGGGPVPCIDLCNN